MTWETYLSGDPTPWLLEPENPSIRYRALVGLLDNAPDDPEARQAGAAIAQQPPSGSCSHFSTWTPRGTRRLGAPQSAGSSGSEREAQ